jgi:hypothetical protein
MLESQDVLLVEASTVGEVVAPGLPRGPESGTGRPGRGRRRIAPTR